MQIPRWLAAAFAAVLLLGACGGDDDSGAAAGSDSSDDATAAELPELPDAEQLQPGLLTIADMPAGWAEVPDDGEDEDDSQLCGIKLAELLGFDADEMPHAEVQFAEDVDVGPSIGEEVGFAPEGRGEDAFQLLRDAIADCEGDTIGGLDVTVSELSFPAVGEESMAYRIHLEDPDSGQELDVDVVWARHGDLLIYLFAYDALDNPTKLLQTYAPSAVDKASAELLVGG
ncbi:MAG TPA: hypothetical protein VEX15_09255 [Nocardioidaceae bacterium]|nr:hypothetical protein [Nocardioidaceae bacterium]